MKINLRVMDETVRVKREAGESPQSGVICGILQMMRTYKVRSGKIISTLEVTYTVRYTDGDQDIISEDEIIKE